MAGLFGLRRALLGGSGDAAASIFASYGTPGILLGDLNPARLMPSGLSPSYLESTGLTAASSSGQTLGLLLERSGGAALGAELVTNGDFADATGWTAGGGWSIGSGVASAASSGTLSRAVTVVAGRSYLLTYTVTARSAGIVTPSLSGGSTINGAAADAVGVKTTIITAATGNTTLGFSASGSPVLSIDNISLKEIAGNHLYQATSVDEPTLVLDSGIWRLRGDGLSKNFLTPLVPAASMTMIVALLWNANNDTVFGSNEASSANKFYMMSDAAGLVSAGVGTQTQTTIKGGSDVRGVPGVAVLRVDGATVSLGWKALSGSFSWVYQAAQSGAPTTSVPVRVGALNSNGAVGLYHDGDIFRLYAQQSALTDAQISAIASQWSRELGGTG